MPATMLANEPITCPIFDDNVIANIVYLRGKIRSQRSGVMSRVYVMSCGDYCKVGIAHVPENRLEQIQAANPLEVVLEAVIEPLGMPASRLEAFMHDKLAKARVRGEWFEGYIMEMFDAVVLPQSD